jgi:hypothetical protein
MNPSTNGNHSAYYDAVTRADCDLQDGIARVRSQQDRGEISLAEAAGARVRLMTAHLELLERLRVTLLGGS